MAALHYLLTMTENATKKNEPFRYGPFLVTRHQDGTETWEDDPTTLLLELKAKRQTLQRELDSDALHGMEWAKKMTRKIGALKAAATRIKKQHKIFPFNI